MIEIRLLCSRCPLYPTHLSLFSFFLCPLLLLHYNHHSSSSSSSNLALATCLPSPTVQPNKMAQGTLSTFLQTTLPPLEADPPLKGDNNPNTNSTNDAYTSEHITGISRWLDFNITTILAKYGIVLREGKVPAKSVQDPQPVVSKTVIGHRVTQYMFP